MVGKARRNFRKDTRKLANILHLLPEKKLAQLMDAMDYFANHSRSFHLEGFLVGMNYDISNYCSAEDLLEFRRTLGVYEARGTALRLISLLRDALRIADLEHVLLPTETSITVPNLNDPVTKRVLQGMSL